MDDAATTPTWPPFCGETATSCRRRAVSISPRLVRPPNDSPRNEPMPEGASTPDLVELAQRAFDATNEGELGYAREPLFA